jgi:hypothetical protein
MAGYIGTKAVNLSTTGADINGDANIDGNLSFGDNNKATFGAGSDLQIYHDGSNSRIADQGTGGLVLQGDAGVYIKSSDNAETMAQFVKDGQVSLWYDNVSKLATSSSGVDIEGTLTSDGLTVDGTGKATFGSVNRYIQNPTGTELRIGADNSSGVITAYTNGSERMRLDASGNLLVGKTSATASAVGVQVQPIGRVYATRDGDVPLVLRRNSSDGAILSLLKDGTTVGGIGSNPSQFIFIGKGDTTLTFADTIDAVVPSGTLGNTRDNVIDLGNSGNRFDDIYATNSTIQTSDANEKQDIAELTDAEQRVAVAAKGLLRKFRWRDAVEAKGDDARTHFGIIAQDLQAAFTAEGLDAGDYAMFISSTWWEHDVEVPAVEAVAEVLDEEGNVVTEAVEAVDAYTRTNTYETQEEAPEGATERTRLGVRYSELLAFIIGAL